MRRVEPIFMCTPIARVEPVSFLESKAGYAIFIFNKLVQLSRTRNKILRKDVRTDVRTLNIIFSASWVYDIFLGMGLRFAFKTS